MFRNYDKVGDYMRIFRAAIYICATICAFAALPAYGECRNSDRLTVNCVEFQFGFSPDCRQKWHSDMDGAQCGWQSCETPCREQCPPCEPTPAHTPEHAVEPMPDPAVKPTVTPAAAQTAAITAAPDTTSATVPSGTDSAYAAEVVRQVNGERAKYGLGALSVDSGLTHAACIRAAEITRQFSHTRPDGSGWSTVSSRARGENIAMGYNSADKVMAAWLASEGHRANILRESFNAIGVCAYEYNGVMYWVQLFGTE